MTEKYFSPRTSFIIICIMLALLPFAVTSFGGFSFASNQLSVLRVLVLCTGTFAAALSWLGSLLKNKIDLKTGPALYLLFALFVLVVLSSIFSISPVEAVFGGFDNPIGMLSYFCLFSLCFLATQLIRGRDDLILLSKTIVFSMLVPALIAFASRIIGYDPISNMSLFDLGNNAYLISRGVGTYGNPDFLGHTLLLPSFLALGFFVSKGELKDKLIYGLSFFILASALVSSAVRGAILALVLGLIFFILLLVLKRAGALSASLLILGTIILALLISIPISAQTEDDILHRFFGSFSQEQSPLQAPSTQNIKEPNTQELASAGATLGGRTIFWKDVPEMVKARPLFGAGPANYINAWHLHRSKDSLAIGSQATMTDAHNLALDLAVNLGIPAALVAIALAFMVLAPALQTSFKLKLKQGLMSEGSGLYLAWTSSLIAMLISSVTAMTTISWIVYLFLILGVLYAPKVKTLKTKGGVDGVRRPAHTLAVLATALLAAPLIWSFLWFSSSAVYASAPKTDAPLKRAQKAVALAPFDINQNALVARLHVNTASGNLQIDTDTRIGLIEEALDMYAEIERLAPSSFNHHEGMAVAYYHLHNLKSDPAALAKGLETAHKGLKLYPAALALRTVSAEALNDAGRFKEAFDLLDGWAGLDPGLEESVIELKRAQEGLALSH